MPRLTDLTLLDLLAAFRSPEPTPGGGSAAALAGALHRLDGEVGTERLPALDERIAQIEAVPGDARDRKSVV